MKLFATLSTASLLWTLVSTEAAVAVPKDVVYVTVYECLAPGAGPFTVIPGVGAGAIPTTIGAKPISVATIENNKATQSQQNQTPAVSQGASSSSGGSSGNGQAAGNGGNGGGGGTPTSATGSKIGGSGTEVNGAAFTSSINSGNGVNGAIPTHSSGAISSSSIGAVGGNGGISGNGQTISTSAANLPYSNVYSFSNYSTSTSSQSSTSSTTLSTVSPTASSFVPDNVVNLLSNGGFSDGLSGWDGSGNVTTEQHGLPNTGDTGNALLTASGDGPFRLGRRQTTGTPATIFQTVQYLPSGSLTVVWLYYAVDMTVQAAGATPQNCKLDVSFGSILMVSSGYFPSTGVPYTALNSVPLALVGTGPLTIAVNCINGGSVAVRVDELTYGISSLVTTPADTAMPSSKSGSSSLASVRTSSISSRSSSVSRSSGPMVTTSSSRSSSSSSRSSSSSSKSSSSSSRSSSSSSRSSSSSSRSSSSSSRSSSSSSRASSSSSRSSSSRTSSSSLISTVSRTSSSTSRSSSITSTRSIPTVSTTSHSFSAVTTTSSIFTGTKSSAPSCTATPAVDQLTNGNFNSGLLTPWTLSLAPNSVASIKNSNNSEHGYVAVVDISHRPTDTAYGATTALQQALTSLTPLTTYTISVDFNVTVADPNVYLQVTIGPLFFKEFAISTYTAGTWHTVTTTYTTGSDTGGLSLSIMTTALATSATQFQLDNIMMLAPVVMCASTATSSSTTSQSLSAAHYLSAPSAELAQTSNLIQPTLSSTTASPTFLISSTSAYVSATSTSTASPLCSAAPTGVQILTNPSFEQGTATTATNWTIGSYSEIETAFAAEDGAKAVLLRGFGLAPAMSLIGVASQNLPCVDTCSQYTVTYYYNTTWFQREYYGAAPTTLVGALCQVRTLFNGVVLDSQPVTAASNGWKYVSLTFIPSASSGALVFQNYCTNGGFATVESKLDIDNISMVRQNMAQCGASTSPVASTVISSIATSVTSSSSSNLTSTASSLVTPTTTATSSTAIAVITSSSTISTSTLASGAQCTTTSAAVNSIINGDFEALTYAPWTLSLGPKSFAYLVNTGDSSHKAALYANISHSSTDAYYGASSSISELITLTPSTTYQISIDYLISRADPNIYLAVQIGATFIVDQTPATVAINTWQTITTTYTTGSNDIGQHISMIITALQDSSSSFLFDNIKIMGPAVTAVGPCATTTS